MSGLSKTLSWSAKLALTFGAFWLALHNIDYAHLKIIVAGQDRTRLLAAAALIGAQIILGSMRWHLILGALANVGRPVMAFTEALKIYYINIFFNNCLPGTVGGDVARVWLAKSGQVPLPLAINSVIIDRVMALIAIGLLVLITLPMLGSVAGFSIAATAPVIALVGLVGILVLVYAERWLAPVKHWRVVHWFLYFVGCLRLMAKRPGASLLSLTYAVAAHVSFCLSAWVLAQSLDISLTLTQSLTLLPLVILMLTLPISIGGWGVREAGMVGLLGLIGVPQAGALVLSLQLGLINVFLSLPAGMLWLTYKKKKAAAHAL